MPASAAARLDGGRGRTVLCWRLVCGDGGEWGVGL
jgi:hypothetical protein